MHAMVTMARSGITHLILLIILAICLGCAPMKVKPGYILQPYYKSTITKDQITAKGLGSIRINTIEFDEPYGQVHAIKFIMDVLPILSLTPLTDLTLKNIAYIPDASRPGDLTYTGLQKGDLENTLASEIKKTGMFDKVEYQGLPKDYDIKGRVNFTQEAYAHFSGFGLICYSTGLLPLLALPMETTFYTCDAHFDVISTKDNKVIFSKDYRSKDSKWHALLYGKSIKETANVFGEDIFPVIVKEFVDDLQHNIKPKDLSPKKRNHSFGDQYGS